MKSKSPIFHHSLLSIVITLPPQAGELIIVDLTCPCITAPMACALFNICLSIFLGQDSSIGRVIALDEAHRYMGESSECETFTNSLLAAIRVQRHVGARIIISTQEPTISPKLLDLCSVTIVHRFSSPDWLSALSKHLAGMSKLSQVTQLTQVVQKLGAMDLDKDDDEEGNGEKNGGVQTVKGRGSVAVASSDRDRIFELFAEIVNLRPGEALVFAPNAVVSLDSQNSAKGAKTVPVKLAHNVLRVLMRKRITEDGGQSVMAS